MSFDLTLKPKNWTVKKLISNLVTDNTRSTFAVVGTLKQFKTNLIRFERRRAVPHVSMRQVAHGPFEVLIVTHAADFRKFSEYSLQLRRRGFGGGLRHASVS